MASIVIKETGNGVGDKMLILEPREALLYPFDFGTGWTSLGLHMYYSFCGVSGDNSLTAPETLISTVNGGTVYDAFYFGFTSYNNPFPYSANNTFIGYFNYPPFPAEIVSTIVRYSDFGVNLGRTHLLMQWLILEIFMQATLDCRLD